MINPLKTIEINHFIFKHPQVPSALNGFQIAQISDIHMGRWVKPRHMAQVVDFINAFDPDINVLTGDYVGYNKQDILRCVGELDRLEAPTYAILGNHDHWASTEVSEQTFEASSIHLLQNEHVLYSHEETSFYIVGIDDHVTKNDDIPAAFEGVRPSKFCLVLNHVPSIGEACAEAGGHLILGGHTHNYQFNIPQFTNRLASRLGAQFFAGPYRFDNAFMYINRGLGSASWPVRIRSLPELSIFTLEHHEMPLLELHEHKSIEIEHRPAAASSA